MTQIAVFGAGSWGTAFASILAAGDNDVRVWGRRQGLVDQLNAGVNDDYLPGVQLPGGISASTDPADAELQLKVGAQVMFLRNDLGGARAGGRRSRRRQAQGQLHVCEPDWRRRLDLPARAGTQSDCTEVWRQDRDLDGRERARVG